MQHYPGLRRRVQMDTNRHAHGIPRDAAYMTAPLGTGCMICTARNCQRTPE